MTMHETPHDHVPGPLGAADRVLRWLSGGLAAVGALSIIGLMGITLVAVVWRYWFRAPISGTGDISQMMLIIVAGAAVAYGARHQAHVSVDLIAPLGRRVTRITDIVMRGLTLFIIGLSVYALMDKACGMERACITSTLSIEHRPFYWYLAVAMAVYAAQVAVHLGIGIATFRGTDPTEVNS
ncbi:TRAP transporter small permease [Jannaschia sp. CCS1]|uniref:TRAP transporter small permease n=1 Tax=Jannaschia sp. (strain CCS1) TaxID=290400 RepID=UPI0002DA3F18|nr:TRAP transporter small permease subunit [Jannaschia sp. CCS1]